jgi:hypothetical protein
MLGTVLLGNGHGGQLAAGVGKLHALHAQQPKGERAGLVDDDRGQVGQFLEKCRATDQDAVARGHGDPGNRRGRRRKH